MIGPVAAGILLATIAPGGAFVFDAVTFLVVILQIVRMRPSPPSVDENEVSWEAIKDGFRFLKGKRNLQSVFLADLNAMVFGFPVALFPAVAERLGGGEVTLGLLYAAPAAGAFVATLLSGRAKHVRRQGRAILFAIAVWGAAIIVFGLSDALWLSLAMLAVAGAGDMVSGIYRSTILQAAVEDRLRGRLDGIGMAVWATGPSVGNVESGVVATLTTVPISIVSGGLLTMAGIGLLRWFAPGFWRYDAGARRPDLGRRSLRVGRRVSSAHPPIRFRIGRRIVQLLAFNTSCTRRSRSSMSSRRSSGWAAPSSSRSRSRSSSGPMTRGGSSSSVATPSTSVSACSCRRRSSSCSPASRWSGTARTRSSCGSGCRWRASSPRP